MSMEDDDDELVQAPPRIDDAAAYMELKERQIEPAETGNRPIRFASSGEGGSRRGRSRSQPSSVQAVHRHRAQLAAQFDGYLSRKTREILQRKSTTLSTDSDGVIRVSLLEFPDATAVLEVVFSGPHRTGESRTRLKTAHPSERWLRAFLANQLINLDPEGRPLDPDY